MSRTTPRTAACIRVAGLALMLPAAIPPTQAAQQEQFLNRPLRLVVPFAPGGGSDITARMVSQRLSENIRQSVIVDNRPGAAGMIGTELVAKAPPDGHTLVLAVPSHVINPSLYKKVNYDALGDFLPVTMAISFPYILAVHPGVPAKTVKELIALAKAQPGKLTFASAGIGLTNHLAAEIFKAATSIDIVHVPYKGGGPALNDLLGGHVSMIFGTVLETLPRARSGALRALAVTTSQRVSFAPELPTVAEAAGPPNYQTTGWYTFLAPKGTPRPIVDFLNREMVKVLNVPALKEQFIGLGAEPWPSTPDEARQFLTEELARWSKLVNQLGLKE